MPARITIISYLANGFYSFHFACLSLWCFSNKWWKLWLPILFSFFVWLKTFCHYVRCQYTDLLACWKKKMWSRIFCRCCISEHIHSIFISCTSVALQEGWLAPSASSSIPNIFFFPRLPRILYSSLSHGKCAGECWMVSLKSDIRRHVPLCVEKIFFLICGVTLSQQMVN